MSAANEPRSRRGLIIGSSVLAAIYCLLFGVIGWTSPGVEILHAFDFPQTWRTPFFSVFHFVWTAPLGVVIAALLLWKDSRLAHRTAKRLNLVSLVIFGAFGCFWFYALLSLLFPLVRGPIISGPRP